MLRELYGRVKQVYAVIYKAEVVSQRELVAKAIEAGVDLSSADLSMMDLRTLQFPKGADLSDANFSGSDVSYCLFYDANLARADFSGARLYQTAFNGARLDNAKLPYVPASNNLHSEVYAVVSKPNHRLAMHCWHTCETTHCRAGWVVVLAGAAGAMLEDLVGTSTAAALIYHASDPEMTTPDFYASNEDALADIRRMAGSPAK